MVTFESSFLADGPVENGTRYLDLKVLKRSSHNHKIIQRIMLALTRSGKRRHEHEAARLSLFTPQTYWRLKLD